MSKNRISATRTIPARAERIFEYLAMPANHVDLDGSGFVRSLSHGTRLREAGDKFTMNMSGDHMGGEYQTDNYVIVCAPNSAIGWETAPAGEDPPGWSWLWTLEEQGDSTDVTVTYDWSEVTDEALLEKVSFPLVEKPALEDSLDRLASAVS